MKQSKTGLYAYTAGIIDGEGCIMINKPHGNFNYYNLRVEVSQKDGRIIDFLMGLWGGTVRGSKNGNDNTVWKWQLCGEKASEMLKRILPFLRYKKLQAEIGINWLYHHRKKQIRKEERDYEKLRNLKLEIILPSVYKLVAETKFVEPSKEGK